jgi:hypothetical protein
MVVLLLGMVMRVLLLDPFLKTATLQSMVEEFTGMESMVL